MVILVGTQMRRRNSLRCTHRIAVALIVAISAIATACSPEVGSESWCAKMKETPSGDWSTNQAAGFAKHCVFK